MTKNVIITYHREGDTTVHSAVVKLSQISDIKNHTNIIITSMVETDREKDYILK